MNYTQIVVIVLINAPYNFIPLIHLFCQQTILSRKTSILNGEQPSEYPTLNNETSLKWYKFRLSFSQTIIFWQLDFKLINRKYYTTNDILLDILLNFKHYLQYFSIPNSLSRQTGIKGAQTWRTMLTFIPLCCLQTLPKSTARLKQQWIKGRTHNMGNFKTDLNYE